MITWTVRSRKCNQLLRLNSGDVAADFFEKLKVSQQNRTDVVIKAKGGHTKYNKVIK